MWLQSGSCVRVVRFVPCIVNNLTLGNHHAPLVPLLRRGIILPKGGAVNSQKVRFVNGCSVFSRLFRVASLLSNSII